jgi:uncharacterized protein GlcG (DUF336 family)
MKFSTALITPILIAASTVQAAEPYVNTRTLSVELASKLAVEANSACGKMGYQVTTSVVDRNGNLLAVVRDPLSGMHTIDVSLKKAQTAATFQTDTLSMQSQAGFEGLRFAKGVLIIGGGIPVRVGGHFYGAVAVSGAPAKKVTGDIDHACAQHGIDAIKEAIEFAE